MPRSSVNKIRSPDRGVVKNLSLGAIPDRAWSNLLNVRCANGVIGTSPGWLKFTSQDVDAPVLHLAQYFKYDGTEFLYAITTTKPWYYNTSSALWVDLSGGVLLTLNNDDVIISDVIFDTFIFTNRIDRVKKLTGSSNYADLSGLDSATDGAGGVNDVEAAKGCVSFANFLHLIMTTEDGNELPQRWRWSRFRTAEGWDNIATYGQAGFSDLEDGQDALMGVYRIGSDFLALYKERSIHLAQYVGPPTIFTRRLAVSNIGLVSPKGVADMGDEHLLIGTDNFYAFNGIALKPIGDRIINDFFQNLNPEKRHLIYTHIIEEENEVMWIYPEVGSDVPNKAVVYNYLYHTWVFRDAPFHSMGDFHETDDVAWDDLTQTWDSLPKRWNQRNFVTNSPISLAGLTSGDFIAKYDDGFSQDGANHDSWAITKAFDLGRPDRVKRFLKILVDICACGSHKLGIEVAVTNNINSILSWGTPKTIAMNLAGDPWVHFDKSGRWGFIRFRTNGTANHWELSGYGTEYIIRSER